MENKIALEQAEKDFDSFIEIWDIDGRVEVMSEKDAESFNEQKSRIIRKIMAGSLVVADDGKVTYTLLHPVGDTTEIILDVTKANTLVMDKYKENQRIHMLNAYVASLSSVNPQTIASLDPRDAKILTAIAALFMGS